MIPLSLAVVAFAEFALALFVWRARVDSATNRSFALFTLLVGVWTIGLAAVFGHGPQLESWRFPFAAASFLPAAFLAFARHYPTLSRWPTRRVSYVNFTLASLFATISLTTDLMVRSATMTPSGPTRDVGLAYPAFAAYFLSAWILALAVFLAKARGARGLARLQLHYLAAGILIGGTGGITMNLLVPLLTGSSRYSWIGPLFPVVFIALVAHAIIRHRLMDLRLVIHRGLTLAIAVLVSLLPVAVFITFAWPRLSLYLETHELVAALTAIALVSLLIPFIRDVAGRVLDRYVYRTHANYQRTVREASRALTRVLDLKALVPFLTDTVATSTRCEGVAIYLRDRHGLRRAAREPRPVQGHFEAPDQAPARVVAALDRTRDLLVSEEVMRERLTEERRELHDDLMRLNWSLVLPLISEDTVIGLIAVGPKLSGDPFYPQDLDLLMTLANQAGVAVKNAQLYAQVLLANEHLNNIVSTIESGVVAVDATGQVTLFNPAAQLLTGLAAERVRFQPLSVLPECVGRMLGETVAEGGARTQPEVQLWDGTTTRPIICTTSPLHDQSGAVLGAVAVFSDLTPLKALEVERQRAERLAYFEMLASGIAHEIKNPLVAVKAFSQLMPRRRTDDRFVAEFDRVVNHEIAKMERLLDRLRTLSHPGERPHHPIDLRAPIGDAIEAMRPVFGEKSIGLGMTMGPSPCTVLADHSELEQLFLNLLMNAHEVTPPEGSVRVEVATTADRAIVAVVDTGPGVPPELLERVFDPFFSTKERGSGLGLAICASIAQTHGARLKAANREGGGAVFTVDFPLAVAATIPAPA